MTYIPLNTSQTIILAPGTSLAPNGVFTSDVQDVSQYGSLSLTCSFVGTATGTLTFSQDGTENVSETYPLSSNVAITVSPSLPSFVFKFTNGSTAQTNLHITMLIHPSSKIPTTKLSQTIYDTSDVMSTRSVISAKSVGGVYGNVGIDNNEALCVRITDPITSFGELAVSHDTPTSQVTFIYGISNVAMTSVGNVFASNGMAVVSAGPGQTSQLFTKRFSKYRPGQGTKLRYTAMFSPGQSGVTQFAGFGGTEDLDALGFGYNGTQFGILYLSHSVPTWIPQSQWNQDTMLGGTPSGQILDPTKVNVFQVKFQYLGGGDIFFHVVNSTNGRWTLVHVIRNANSNTQPNMRNPILQTYFEVVNTSGSSQVKVSSASLATFIEGNLEYTGPRYCIDSSVSTNNNLFNMMFIQNPLSYNGITNKLNVNVLNISFGMNSTKSNDVATLRVLKNAPFTGTAPTYLAVSGTTTSNGLVVTNSSCPLTYNVNSISTTSTQTVGDFGQVISSGSATTVDLSSYDLFLNPGEYFVFSIVTSSGSTLAVNLSVIVISDQ